MSSLKDPRDFTPAEELFSQLRSSYLDIDQAWIVLSMVLDEKSPPEVTDLLSEEEVHQLEEACNTIEGQINKVKEVVGAIVERHGINRDRI